MKHIIIRSSTYTSHFFCTKRIDTKKLQMNLTKLIVLVVASPILVTGEKPSFPIPTIFGTSAAARNRPGQRRWTVTKTGVFAIRGGAVHESQTLGDLESRIQSAALRDKLTVIDFTATW
jgi:hypothetical protein